MGRFVIGVSGASGIVLAKRLMEALGALQHHMEVIFSPHALYTASLELGKSYSTGVKFCTSLSPDIQKHITLHPIQDVGSTIASGSFLTDGMIIIPCSMATLAAIAAGFGENTMHRAADVTLKEKRPLVIVPREAPFGELHLENMLKLARLGATIVPPVPAWYTAPKSLEEVENYIVGKVLDSLKIAHSLYPRWVGASKISGCL